MQKLALKQQQLQRLSPQQIQFIKLLQIPTMELSYRIEKELEENPILESADMGFEEESDFPDDQTQEQQENTNTEEELSMDDYWDKDDIYGYKMYGERNYEDERPEIPIKAIESLSDLLTKQLGWLMLDETEYAIGKQIIGSIEADGYLRYPLESIVNDMAFSSNIYTTYEKVENILHKIQTFDPPGIASRSLKECLLMQLGVVTLDESLRTCCIEIIEKYFHFFSKKHYDKIIEKLSISKEKLRQCIDFISSLNPKPIQGIYQNSKPEYITPDFIIKKVNKNIQIILHQKNDPHLYISPTYLKIFESYSHNAKKKKELKETTTFIKNKLDTAKWFLDALQQRKNTMLKTMESIVNFQKDFFLTLEIEKLKPMIIKNIADDIGMDISTVSRVVSGKFLQTDIGIYPLKFFFSESISTTGGKKVSNTSIKSLLEEIIHQESKEKPHTDEDIQKIFKQKGYILARRTIAKYRKQMDILNANLRREV